MLPILPGFHPFWGQLYLAAARGRVATVTLAMPQPVPYGAELKNPQDLSSFPHENMGQNSP